MKVIKKYDLKKKDWKFAESSVFGFDWYSFADYDINFEVKEKRATITVRKIWPPED